MTSCKRPGRVTFLKVINRLIGIFLEPLQGMQGDLADDGCVFGRYSAVANDHDVNNLRWH